MSGDRAPTTPRRRRPGAFLTGAMAVSRLNRRRALGDHRFLFVAAGLPLIIILLVGFLFGSAQKAPLGIVELGHGPLATRLVTLLERSDALKVSFSTERGAVRDDVLREILAAGIVIPADFDATLEGGGRARIDIVTQVGQSLSAQARAAVVEAVDVVSAEWSSAEAAARIDHIPVTQALARAERTTDTLYAAADAHDAASPQSPYAYTTAGNLVLFGFITLLVSSVGLVESRSLGLLRRMLATPTPPGAVVVGQTMSVATLGIVQGLGLLVIGETFFGVHWGDLTAAVLLVVAVALVAAGASVCVGTMARSPEQAIAVATVGGIALGMLGGCMWPLDVVGPAMRTLGHATPQAWAMDGFVKLVYGHTGLAGVLPELAVLLGFAVVLLAVGTRRLRAAVVSGA